MAFVIFWFFLGVVSFWFLHDFPTDPSVADKTQWKIRSKPLRVMLRLSMLLAGPIWVVIAVTTGIYLGGEWLFKQLWSALTK